MDRSALPKYFRVSISNLQLVYELYVVILVINVIIDTHGDHHGV